MSNSRLQHRQPASGHTWRDFVIHLLWGISLLTIAMASGSLIVHATTVQGTTISLDELVPLSDGGESNPHQLRVGIPTHFSPRVSFQRYQALAAALTPRLDQSLSLSLRSSHGKLRQDLAMGNIDVALVPAGSYALMNPADGHILAVPQLPEGQERRSVFIVANGSSAMKLADLAGQRVAFTDPESATGCIVANQMLIDAGLTDDSIFRLVVFTGSHDHSIKAVANGYVDAAAVSSVVVDQLIAQDPTLATRIRILASSAPVPPPPVVVRQDLPPEQRERLHDVLLALDQDETGQRLLAQWGIARFVEPTGVDYSWLLPYHRRIPADGAGREGRP